ncbi:hypothetical protein [Flavobacterium sp. GT3P67]|nr:hypothetical protein [Flavobacterium sp. GT3P67]
MTKIGNYRLFSTIIDICFLKSALIDRIFAVIIPDLVATNSKDDNVVQLF